MVQSVNSVLGTGCGILGAVSMLKYAITMLRLKYNMNAGDGVEGEEEQPENPAVRRD